MVHCKLQFIPYQTSSTHILWIDFSNQYLKSGLDVICLWCSVASLQWFFQSIFEGEAQFKPIASCYGTLHSIRSLCLSHTAKKVSAFGVFLVRMRGNMYQKVSEYGHFLCSAMKQLRYLSRIGISTNANSYPKYKIHQDLRVCSFNIKAQYLDLK